MLSDRVRMAAHSANPNVFIRSLAARGHLGGVTRTTRPVIELFAAGGMDLVIAETVGTGQSEVEVAGLTDVKIAVCAPGLGDEMQAIKAGFSKSPTCSSSTSPTCPMPIGPSPT